MSNPDPIYLGIDVAKDSLEVATWPVRSPRQSFESHNRLLRRFYQHL